MSSNICSSNITITNGPVVSTTTSDDTNIVTSEGDPTTILENTGTTATSDVTTIVADVTTTKPTEDEEKNIYKR